MQVLIRSVASTSTRDCFVTLVYKVKRDSFPHYDDPYYMREYLNKEAAAAGHAETVQRLASGKLPLKRIHFGFEK